jgi:hypothetical protein
VSEPYPDLAGDAALIKSLEARMGATVLLTDAIDAGTVYLMPPRWEGVRIVQEGMAEIVDWLRAAGHDMPDAWAQQADDRRQRRANTRGYLFEWFPLTHTPPSSFVTMTGVTP